MHGFKYQPLHKRLLGSPTLVTNKRKICKRVGQSHYALVHIRFTDLFKAITADTWPFWVNLNVFVEKLFVKVYDRYIRFPLHRFDTTKTISSNRYHYVLQNRYL